MMLPTDSTVGNTTDPVGTEVMKLCAYRCDGEENQCEDNYSSRCTLKSDAKRLPPILELTDVCDGNATCDMNGSCKPRTPRPGRKYSPACAPNFATESPNGGTVIGPSPPSDSAGLRPNRSAPDVQSAICNGGKNLSRSFSTPAPPTSPRRTSGDQCPGQSPRSPRMPRRLTPLDRSGSSESPVTSPRDKLSSPEPSPMSIDTETSDNDDDELSDTRSKKVSFSWNKPLPDSSFAFQQALYDLNSRRSSTDSHQSPGDLMVRRSSLVGILAVPDLNLNGRTDSDDNPYSLDLELTSNVGDENGDDCSENSECNNNTEKTAQSPKESKSQHGRHSVTKPRVGSGVERPRKKHSTQEAPKVQSNPEPSSQNNAQEVPQRRTRKIGIVNPNPAMVASAFASETQEQKTNNPGIIVSSPKEDMLAQTARNVTRAKASIKKWRFSEGSRSVCSLNPPSDVCSEASPKLVRKISDSVCPLTFHDKTRFRSHRDVASPIDMKTVAHIARFITAAAASSVAPGLNKNQQLLPQESTRLPVLDPAGRLLQRRRDDAMRLVKVAVDQDTAGDDSSDVYSWDELRDCRYLRSNKTRRGSRRNSLLGFNEI